jgi:hypothetical protein
LTVPRSEADLNSQRPNLQKLTTATPPKPWPHNKSGGQAAIIWNQWLKKCERRQLSVSYGVSKRGTQWMRSSNRKDHLAVRYGKTMHHPAVSHPH